MAVTPEDFGAIGNGVSHPISERFQTLGQAQGVYPHVTSMTDECDWAAWQAAINQYGRLGVQERYVPGPVCGTPGQHYVINKSIRLRQSYLKFDGRYCAIRNTNASVATILVDHDDVHASPLSVRVERVYLMGGNRGVDAYSAPELEIQNVFVKDLYHSIFDTAHLAYGTQGQGIRLNGCVSATIRDCGIDKPGSIGVYVRAYEKTAAGQSVIAESQKVLVDNVRVNYGASVGILFSEGGSHVASNCTVQVCAGGGIIWRSVYSFTGAHNYFEANGNYDLIYEYLPEYLAERNSSGALLIDNQCASTNNILLASGADTRVFANRLSGASVISAQAQRTRWGAQTEQGSLTNSAGASTIFEA